MCNAEMIWDQRSVPDPHALTHEAYGASFTQRALERQAAGV
jgi:hypothetical protein